MTELFILVILNILIAVGVLVWEYFLFVGRRKSFDDRVTALSGEKKTTTSPYVFFPDSWKKLIEPIISKFSVEKDGTAGSILSQITPVQLVMINIALVVISFNIQTITKVQWYISVLVLLGAEGGMYWYLKGKQVLVREAIEKKLPEILDIMARVYRVHTDLRVAVSEVGEHSSDEIVRKQFKQVAQLARFGYSVEDALGHLAEEVKSADLDFVVSSIRLNAPMGGNLPYLFEHTAQMLRQRKEANDEINNLMFQNKISANGSALLVPIITVVSFASSSKYQEVLLRNPTGRMIFFFCLIWWLIGVVIIRKNSRISL